MKKLLLCLGLVMSLVALADEKADQEAMMAKWKEYATPGEAHKVITGLTGKWKYTSKMWQSEKAKPEESSGQAQFWPMMDGRFVKQDVKGKAMGMPFNGMMIMGYNNIKKAYETVWIDNMGTGITLGTATFDAATKTMKEDGKFTCPEKTNEMKYRSEWKFIDNKNFVYTMWTPDMKSGNEFKSMEMVYKKAK